MAKFTCVYFTTDSGRVPVEEFIDTLNSRSRQKFFGVIGLLEEFGRRLPEPHAKYIGDEIYELRFQCIDGHVRIMYFFFAGEKIILTNGFVKKSWKVPEKELETALERRRMYLERRG